jgi:DNA replication protein DnaD
MNVTFLLIHCSFIHSFNHSLFCLFSFISFANRSEYTRKNKSIIKKTSSNGTLCVIKLRKLSWAGLLSMALQSFCWTMATIQFLNPIHSLDGEIASRKAAIYTQNKTNIEQTHTNIHAFEWGFEPTFPVFQRAKTAHVLDRAAVS